MKFELLDYVLEKVFKQEEKEVFFKQTLPFIQKMVLKTPELFKDKIPMLFTGKKGEISLSREQCCCILANCFFCTFSIPTNESLWGLTKLPSINFDELFGDAKNIEAKIAKILMILHYFDRLKDGKCSPGNVTIKRMVCQEFIDYKTSKTTFEGFSPKIYSKGSIEDDFDSLQADFANAYIGGGALSYGCVQEEIRFCINPECIVSRLFCYVMESNEAIIIDGTEQFSIYKGYAQKLGYGGDYQDKNLNEKGEIKTRIVAMDALIFMRDKGSQFQEEKVKRELNKAYVAFNDKESKSIATGNWGCGTFCGDKELKSILQWIAATEAKKEMNYYTFGDEKLSTSLKEITDFIISKKLTIGDVYNCILKFHNPSAKESTFAFIKSEYEK